MWFVRIVIDSVQAELFASSRFLCVGQPRVDDDEGERVMGEIRDD
jgi:hypothetical protein